MLLSGDWLGLHKEFYQQLVVVRQPDANYMIVLVGCWLFMASRGRRRFSSTGP